MDCTDFVHLVLTFVHLTMEFMAWWAWCGGWHRLLPTNTDRLWRYCEWYDDKPGFRCRLVSSLWRNQSTNLGDDWHAKRGITFSGPSSGGGDLFRNLTRFKRRLHLAWGRIAATKFWFWHMPGSAVWHLLLGSRQCRGSWRIFHFQRHVAAWPWKSSKLHRSLRSLRLLRQITNRGTPTLGLQLDQAAPQVAERLSCTQSSGIQKCWQSSSAMDKRVMLLIVQYKLLF